MRIVPLLSALALGSLAATAVGTETRAAPDEKLLCVHGLEAPRALDLRSGPSARHAVTAQLAAGTCGLKIVGQCTNGWCEVEADGRKGWADTRFVSVNDRDPGVPTVVRPIESKPAEPAPVAPVVKPVAAAPPPPAVILPDEEAAKPARVARRPVARVARRTEARPASPTTSQPASRSGWRDAPRAPDRTLSRTAVRVERPLWPLFQWRSLCRPEQRCVVNVERWDTLRLRTGPGVEHRAIAAIPPTACGVARRGSCVGLWCEVRFRSFAGWVNTRYLN